MNLKSSMGLLLSKLGAPLEPGNGIILVEFLPLVTGVSWFELSGPSDIFVFILVTAEFEFILSVARADNLGCAGIGGGNASFLNEYLCVTAFNGCRTFRLGGVGKPELFPAFRELAVSLTFAGAVLNDAGLALIGIAPLLC